MLTPAIVNNASELILLACRVFEHCSFSVYPAIVIAYPLLYLFGKKVIAYDCCAVSPGYDSRWDGIVG